MVLGGTVKGEISICFLAEVFRPGDLTTVGSDSGTDVPRLTLAGMVPKESSDLESFDRVFHVLDGFKAIAEEEIVSILRICVIKELGIVKRRLIGADEEIDIAGHRTEHLWLTRITQRRHRPYL